MLEEEAWTLPEKHLEQEGRRGEMEEDHQISVPQSGKGNFITREEDVWEGTGLKDDRE